MTTKNRLGNVHNQFQGSRKRILCVCSAGLLRSPTAAFVLSNRPFDFNTRSAGLDTEWALIPVDEVLLEWADVVVCMTRDQFAKLMLMTSKPVFCLDIPDSFEFRDPELEIMIDVKCREAFGIKE